MNLLLARFSLFLVMIAAIAGSALVPGTASSGGGDQIACATEIASVGAGALTAQRERTGTAAARSVRWQSLLPGAFR